MSNPSPPPHLVALADDNQLGFLLIFSMLLAIPGISHYMGWGDFFNADGALISTVRLPMTIIGLLLFLNCVRRLLLPGCRILLRINHGGLTDFRLCNTPFEWKDINSATRLPGSIGGRLPIIMLDIEPARLAQHKKSLWYSILHFTLQRKNNNHLIVLCDSLDSPTSKIFTTIQAHLSHKK
ncbi:MAG: hypothetical protein HQL71_11285 [Magnetococcales bacterium]|nr:hypothetical protein [Magnetococcales bacterium]